MQNKYSAILPRVPRVTKMPPYPLGQYYLTRANTGGTGLIGKSAPCPPCSHR